jgi:hypothetical protein
LIEWTFDPLVSRNAYLNISLASSSVDTIRLSTATAVPAHCRMVAERPRPAITGEQRHVTIPADWPLVQNSRGLQRVSCQYQGRFLCGQTAQKQ